jgi:hypothetical protein
MADRAALMIMAAEDQGPLMHARIYIPFRAFTVPTSRDDPRQSPSGDHIPLGGFVFNPTIEPFGQHRDVHSSGMIMPGSPT